MFICCHQERLKKEYKTANKTREGYVDESEDEDEPTLTSAGKGLRKTLQKLEKRKADLEGQISEYHNYVESAMSTMQRGKR